MTSQTSSGTANRAPSRKTALVTSTAIFMMMAAAPMAQAQIVITDGQTTPVFDPNGETVTAAAGVTQTIANTDADDDPDNGNIVLDGSNNDGTVITNDGTLINLDTQDENVVIFVDNGEDDVVVTNNGTLQGINGVVFFEGDSATLTNSATGIIEGTGSATEGVVYFDRDVDGNENIVTNAGRITSVGGPTIGLDSLLGTAASSGDTASATAENPNQFGGTLVLTLNNSGTIENTGSGNAIFFNGDPGSTSEGSSGSQQRGCIENIAGGATNIQCQFNIDLDNSGTISAASDIAIRGEDEAVISGTIDNTADGTISGTTGILIAGAHAEHDLAITNAGAITGTDGAGLSITGDGVDLVNQAGGSITGTTAGLFVSGSTATVRSSDRNDLNTITTENGDIDIVVAGINNTFSNAGAIAGGGDAPISVDLSGAGEAVTFNQLGGGVLTGDFLGTSGDVVDTFNVSNGLFTLTDDILQTVNVNVAEGGTLAFDGGNRIEGDLVSDGTLDFDLADEAVVVTGDVTLNTGSVVNVVVSNPAEQVTQAAQQFTLIDVGGTLTNNASLTTNVEEDSLLLDFVAVTNENGDLVVQTQANDVVVVVPDDMMDDMPVDMMDDMPVEEPAPEPLTVVIPDANEGAFATAVFSAFAAGGLDDTAGFSQLADLTNEDQDEIAAIIAENLPDEGNAVGFEITEIVQDVNNIIGGRLNSLTGKTAHFGGGVEQFAQSSTRLTDASNNYGSSTTGPWVQGGYRYARQSGDSSNGSNFNGYTADVVNFAIGYDYALTADSIVGISGSYSSADTDERSGNGEAEIDLFQAILYGAKNYGPINVSAQASYSFGDVTAERTTSIETITGEFDVDGFNIEGEASYQFDLEGSGYIAPLAGLRYGNFSSDEFTEDGGFDAIIGGNTTDLFEGRLGAITGNQYSFSNAVLDVYAHGAYVYNFGGGVDDLDIIVGGQSASLERFEFDDQRVELGLGANWVNEEGFSLGASLDGEAGSSYTSIGGRVRAKFNF